MSSISVATLCARIIVVVVATAVPAIVSVVASTMMAGTPKLLQFYRIVWCGNFVKSTVSGELQVNHPKLSGNCVLPQKFHSRKLGKISVFYALSRDTLMHIFMLTIPTMITILC